ncbi:MAG: hypothetical protein ABWX74_14055 [Aeromicrobium sp.]
MTGTSLYFVQSNAVEGRDDEFNEWYDLVHVPDVLALDGFMSAQRFKRSTALDGPDAGAPEFTYVALYEIEGDPVTAVKRLGTAVKAGDIPLTDSMAPGTTSILFDAIGDKVRAS